MFKFHRRAKPVSDLTAISFNESEICLVGLSWHGGHPAITLWERCRADGDVASALKRLSRQFGLDQGKCTCVLNSQDYRLLVTDEPSVPKAEMRGALRWRIKDLIDMPIQEVTLDIFDVPQIPSSSVNSIYVVAAKNDAIKRYVNAFVTAGINLHCIDIPEMALRNIAGLLPEDEAGIATLVLQKDQGMILITRQKELYLSRALSVGSEMFSAGMQENAFNQIVLELQRSMDYVESRFRQPPIRHIALDPTTYDSTDFADFLRTNLGISVIKFEVESILEKRVAVPEEWQKQHLLLLGAALRQESVGS